MALVICVSRPLESYWPLITTLPMPSVIWFRKCGWLVLYAKVVDVAVAVGDGDQVARRVICIINTGCRSGSVIDVIRPLLSRVKVTARPVLE